MVPIYQSLLLFFLFFQPIFLPPTGLRHPPHTISSDASTADGGGGERRRWAAPRGYWRPRGEQRAVAAAPSLAEQRQRAARGYRRPAENSERRRRCRASPRGDGERRPAEAGERRRQVAPRGGRRPRRAEAAGSAAWRAATGLVWRRAEASGRRALPRAGAPRVPLRRRRRVGMEEVGSMGPIIGHPK